MEAADFKFTNDHMFNRVMSDPSICRRVLERILGVRIGRIEYRNNQQEARASVFARGIRMDVYLEGGDGVYDIEIQSRADPLLAKRFRYYQAMIDSGLLERGDDYDLLPESWIIFLCEGDPFARGLPVYTVERSCLEDAGLEVGCGSHWLVLNASAWRKEDDGALRALLQYVETGTVAEGDPLMNDIDEAVFAANHDARWTDDVFSVSTIAEDMVRHERIMGRRAAAEARAEGLAEGIAEGRAEGLAEGEARYNRLVVKLASEGRLEELARAAEDPALLDALFEEL